MCNFRQIASENSFLQIGQVVSSSVRPNKLLPALEEAAEISKIKNQ